MLVFLRGIKRFISVTLESFLMVRTRDYLMIGFGGNPDKIGFGEDKTPPPEVYFDYLGIDKSGGLYVERSESPLFKLLHPDYEDAENILINPTKIGSIRNNDFYKVLNEKPLTREEMRDAFWNDTNLNLKNGFPYIYNTIIIETDFLDCLDAVAETLYGLSHPEGVLSLYNGDIIHLSKGIRNMKHSAENDDEIESVYMIVPESSSIVDQVFEIHQRTLQQPDRS